MGQRRAVGYGGLVQELDDFYKGELRLVPMLSPKGNWIGCENQMPFDDTTRVKEFTDRTRSGSWTIRLLLRCVPCRALADRVLLRGNPAT